MKPLKIRELSDAELVQRAQRGEFVAFDALTARYEGQVYSFALGTLPDEEMAEELTRATFLTALEDLEGFHGSGSFAAWLWRIAAQKAAQKGAPDRAECSV